MLRKNGIPKRSQVGCRQAIGQRVRCQEDAVLMLEEIEWHLKRIVKILNQFLEHGPDTELQIKQLIRETLPQPEPQVKLEDYAIS